MPRVKPELYCSFYGKSQGNVDYLVVGVNAFICKGCVELCGELIKEREISKLIKKVIKEERR